MVALSSLASSFNFPYNAEILPDVTFVLSPKALFNVEESSEFDFNISLISALGFVCYIISFLLYTRIVMMFENLSFISPICNGVAQIMILIASWLILKEQLTGLNIGGAALIIAGVIIMNLNK